MPKKPAKRKTVIVKAWGVFTGRNKRPDVVGDKELVKTHERFKWLNTVIRPITITYTK